VAVAVEIMQVLSEDCRLYVFQACVLQIEAQWSTQTFNTAFIAGISCVFYFGRVQYALSSCEEKVCCTNSHTNPPEKPDAYLEIALFGRLVGA
jgi:hypothetical protein